MSDDEEVEEHEAEAGGVGRAASPDRYPHRDTHELPPSNYRRDENPFSLRHFLRGAPGAYERTGARPKTYNTTSPERGEREQHGLPSLPDFVQDHMLPEPPYAESSAAPRARRLPEPPPPPRLSLDLTESVPHEARPPHTFPLDLPPPEGRRGREGGSGVGLPDFLPLQSSRIPATSDTHRLQGHIDNLTVELYEQRARCAQLERELTEMGAAGGGATHARQESESEARRECEVLRARQAAVARAVRLFTDETEEALRELMSGVERLRGALSTLETP